METNTRVTQQPYGTTQDGQAVDEYTLTSAAGLEVKIITYGGIITSLRAPAQDGELANVVLGLPNLAEYEANNPYFGCIVGRFGNRIAGGQFSLDGTTYMLAVNNGPNHLHGGLKGFDKQVWEVRRAADDAVELHYLSPDMEENYPGNLDTTVTYTITGDNGLRIDYRAVTDKPTIVNLTNHTLWNLAGEGSGTIEHHVMHLNCDHYTPVDKDMIPTGEIAPVAGTPLDFRRPTPIHEVLRADHPQIAYATGIDHNWVINRRRPADTTLVQAAAVVDPDSGRRLEIWTTEPGVQFYTGNFLTGAHYGPSGRAYRQGDGLALETQHYPDSPNHENFPTTVLRPGEVYRSTTELRFTTV